MSEDFIRVRGARVNNLRGVDVDIPRRRLTVVTGPSGSGKSSLVFDTIYAEAQRRFGETLDNYARRYLDQLDRPEVDEVSGLSPAVALAQRGGGPGPRSSVGTLSEAADYARLLFASAGRVWCPRHQVPLRRDTIEDMLEAAAALPEGSRAMVLAPLVDGARCALDQVAAEVGRRGFTRLRVDGQVMTVEEALAGAEAAPRRVEVVVDRLRLGPQARARLAESLETASGMTRERILLVPLDGAFEEQVFTLRWACPRCDFEAAEPTPAMFSPRQTAGACPRCGGRGLIDLPGAAAADEAVTCPDCGGLRYRPETLNVWLGDGKTRINIGELGQASLWRADELLGKLEFSGPRRALAAPPLAELRRRLRLLRDIGLGHLSLDREADTLSAGELQRIRLVSRLCAGLTGVTYVLDEPTVGLHREAVLSLIGMLRQLVEEGNTVIVVEHDRDLIRAADMVIELGPGAGENGGAVVASGSPAAIMDDPDSLTGRFLRRGQLGGPAPRRRAGPGPALYLRGATGRGLSDVSARFPLGALTAVTGPSGCGKTALIRDTLAATLRVGLGQRGSPPLPCRGVSGAEGITRVVEIGQEPVGRTPKSNPATFMGAFGPIRELFASTEGARWRGYGAARFSFNLPGGRCEDCGGEGFRRVSMGFMPSVYALCERCHGARYNRETLDVRYQGLNIAEVLDLTVDRARELFANHPDIRARLDALERVGLGYLKLGQGATTLSGGEAQRLRLARELAGSERRVGHTLYILDEPTAGLHPVDTSRLLAILRELAEQGHTVVLSEHDRALVARCDWLVELGSERPGGPVTLRWEGSPSARRRGKKS